MTATDPTIDPTGPRSPGLTYQQLLDADTNPVPDALRLESPRHLGDTNSQVDIGDHCSRAITPSAAPSPLLEWRSDRVDQTSDAEMVDSIDYTVFPNFHTWGGDRAGILGTDGHWISGELRECDPHLRGWVVGPQIGSHGVSAAVS